MWVKAKDSLRSVFTKNKEAVAVPYRKEKEETISSFVKFAEGDGLPQWPLEIFLEISNVCNLRCAMCNTFSALSSDRNEVIQGTQRGFMDVRDITSAMEPLFAHALQVHAFGYGEPTIHPEFKGIIDHLSKYGVMVDFFTNGMRLDQEMCEFLVDRKISKITVSISGATKADYESIYLGGDFNKVLSALKQLQQLKKARNTKFPIVEVNSIAFTHHVEKFLDFVEMMGMLGVQVIHLKPLSTYDRIQELHGHLSFPRLDVEIPMLERAREAARKYGMIIGSKPYENMASRSHDQKHLGRSALSTEMIPLSQIAEIARNRQVGTMPENIIEKNKVSYLDPASLELVPCEGVPCFEPFKTFYVAYSGDVYPCCFKNSSTALGNIRKDAGLSIWNNEAFIAFRKEIVKSTQYPSGICRGCLKKQSYPQGHATGYRVSTYNEWCSEAFGVPLPNGMTAAAKALRPNKDILAFHKNSIK